MGVSAAPVLGKPPAAKRQHGFAYPAGGAAFSPSDITGLVGWWDFSDATTLYTDAGTTLVANDGDLIYQADDKSGTSRPLLQTTESVRPDYKVNIVNGLSVARCTDAGNEKMVTANITQAQPFTIFMVVRMNTLPADGAFPTLIVASGGSVPQFSIIGTGDALRFLAGATFTTTLTVNTDNPMLLMAQGNSTSSKVRVDGSEETGDAGTQGWSTETFAIDTSAGCSVDYGEILFYDTAISGADLTAIEGYLQGKWGTP